MAGQNTVVMDFSTQENPLGHPAAHLKKMGDYAWLLQFEAMASPCEIHIEATALQEHELDRLCRQAIIETWRIENKYSRYHSNNIIYAINNAEGKPTEVDTETANLLTYAEQCYELSSGMFDITTGPLRKAWKFHSQGHIPTQATIDQLLTFVGWQKCKWENPYFSLPLGGELDFGGIGKEYAVDKVCQLFKSPQHQKLSALVNYGGDIACTSAKLDNTPWKVGLEQITSTKKTPAEASHVIPLAQGAVATSGDTHRYLIYKGKRISHILNPLTGWPVTDAPQTVSVQAPTCTLAGMLATFAMLQGAKAEEFLIRQGFPHWVQRIKSC